MRGDREVFVVSAARTPIGRFGGSLRELTAADLGVIAVRAVLERSGVAPADVEEVIMGMARQAGNGPNPSRQVGVRAGLDESIPAYTVNQACGSGLKAVMLGCDAIALGRADVIVAGGMESMTRVPYLVDSARWGVRLGHQELTDGMYRDGLLCPLAGMVMGETADLLADIHGISRGAQDAYAIESQRRAGAAQESGRFLEELAPVNLPVPAGSPATLAHDEHVRAGVSLAEISELRPVFRKNGTVTAGNSSGITDGAAATLLMSGAQVDRRGVTPLCRILDFQTVGVDPKLMGIGPVPAVRKLLERTRIRLDRFDLVELNEAFAAQVLACLEELPIDRERLNVNGGAIALGHPIGCTGTRILTTLAHEMNRRGSRYGLATLCVSGGLGIAMAVERV